MYEALPLGTGTLLGGLVGAFRRGRAWTALVAVIAVVVGFLAAWMSGELELSFGFVVFDICQVLVMYFLASWLARIVAALSGLRAS